MSGFAGDLGLRLTIASLVVIAALYQCFWNLAGSNITGDENIYLQSGWQYVHGDFTANREHPPTIGDGLCRLGFGRILPGPARRRSGR